MWHIQTVMWKGIKFILAHHQSFWTAAAVRLFMINDSMILLFISLSCMLMMWFNVPVLFKDFLLDIHPSWPDFFHPELKMLVKRVNIANPDELNIFTFSRLTDIDHRQMIYFAVNLGYRGGCRHKLCFFLFCFFCGGHLLTYIYCIINKIHTMTWINHLYDKHVSLFIFLESKNTYI